MVMNQTLFFFLEQFLCQITCKIFSCGGAPAYLKFVLNFLTWYCYYVNLIVRLGSFFSLDTTDKLQD
jgi:hypothetical protein